MTSRVPRPLVEADLDRVWEIFCAGSADVAAEEPLLPFDAAHVDRSEFVGSIVTEMADDEHRHLVVEQNGECAGWGHGFVARSPEGLRIGYVAAVYVDRSSRQQRIGSDLLKALADWLREQDVIRIELVTPSRSAARGLWLRRGFRPLLETLVLDESDDRQ